MLKGNVLVMVRVGEVMEVMVNGQARSNGSIRLLKEMETWKRLKSKGIKGYSVGSSR